MVDTRSGFNTLSQTSTPKICGMIKFSHDYRFLLCWHVTRYNHEVFRVDLKRIKQSTLSLEVTRVDDILNSGELESLSEDGFCKGDPFSSIFQISADGFQFVEVAHGFILNGVTVIIGHPCFTFLEMLSKPPLERGIELPLIEDLCFSLDGETVYGITDWCYSIIMSWCVSSGELTLDQESGTTFYTRLVPLRRGILFLTGNRTIELWNFELTECLHTWSNFSGIK